MPVTPDSFADFTSTTIAGGAGGIGTVLGASDVTAIVATGTGAKFPNPGGAVGSFVAMIGPLLAGGVAELTLCTARSGDTLTLTRNIGGTNQAWPVGTQIQAAPSALNFNNLWRFVQYLPYLRPAADGTGAIQLQNAAGNLGLLVVDTTNNLVFLNVGFAVGQSGSAQTLVASSTITISGLGAVRVTEAAAVAGIIMPVGTYGGQLVTVINEAAFTITFAVSGTSHVAAGTSEIIPAGPIARTYIWDSGTSLWYHVG